MACVEPCDVTCDVMQGDKERELGLPISPLMNRAHQGGMTRSQVPHPFFSSPSMFDYAYA